MSKFYPILDASILKVGQRISCALNGSEINYQEDENGNSIEDGEIEWFDAEITSIEHHSDGGVFIELFRADIENDWVISIYPSNIKWVLLEVNEWDD